MGAEKSFLPIRPECSRILLLFGLDAILFQLVSIQVLCPSGLSSAAAPCVARLWAAVLHQRRAPRLRRGPRLSLSVGRSGNLTEQVPYGEAQLCRTPLSLLNQSFPLTVGLVLNLRFTEGNYRP